MSDAVLLCPHCGKKQSSVASAISGAVAAARTQARTPGEDVATLGSVYFVREPRLSPPARLAETALIVLTLPALVLATACLVSIWIRLQIRQAFGREAGLELSGGLLRALFLFLALCAMYPLLMALTLDAAVAIWFVAIQAVLVVVREGLRHRT
jgi:hypothetical protein